jgi:hypothetical protein
MAKPPVLKNCKSFKYTNKFRIIPENILMFGPKKDEVTEGGCCLHDERFQDLPAQNNLWVIKKLKYN